MYPLGNPADFTTFIPTNENLTQTGTTRKKNLLKKSANLVNSELNKADPGFRK